VIIGDGILKHKLQHQIIELGLEQNLVLTGFREDIDTLFPQLDLFVLPSFTEGLPNVILEAMSASVPVVATKVGGTPELFENNVHGLLVESGNFEEMANAIISILINDARRLEMSSLTKTHVMENFSFQAQDEKYRHLTEKLIADKQ